MRPNPLVLFAFAALPAQAQFLGEAPRLASLDTRAPAKAAATGAIDRASVVRLYHTKFLPAESVASGWTGSVGGCQPGTTSNAFKQSVLDRLNTYRALVRLPAVALAADSRATDVQNAALMFSANSDLDHFPPNTWTCYTSSGANGASHANIALGMTGLVTVP